MVMGFKNNVADSYTMYKGYDDGTIGGAINVAYSIVNLLPCMVVWHFFMVTPENLDSGNGGIAMVCGCCCGCFKKIWSQDQF